MRVVVGGPPHSGKSTFTAALIERVRERKRERPFNLSFTWMTLDVTDNSLAWLLDREGDVQRKLDETGWSSETAHTRRAAFEGRDERLVIADAPGMLTPELDIVIEPADLLIILASKEKREKIAPWKQRAAHHGIEVGWIITSVLESDTAPGWKSDVEGDGARRGVIRSIERGEFVSNNVSAYDDVSARMLRQLSTALIRRAVESDR